MIASRFFCLLLLPSAAFASVPAPVAVMPFKNLNQDPALDWLKVGVAETMVSDLKKLASVRVVEREQVDKALAEILLQGKTGTDESTAARVGKLIGAQTIVLGSFQTAGKDLRIVARFVKVESGEVLDTAKATGPLSHVFGLQDEIVTRLVGQAPATKKLPTRKTGPQVVKAYRLYAMSLTTASDADRVGFLRDSLEADPSFTYASDDLAKLEQRMKQYSAKSDQVVDARIPELVRALTDPGTTPQDRSQKAMSLMTQDMSQRRWRLLKAHAAQIARLELPAMGTMTPTEMAVYFLFMAHHTLKERDQALQVGEQYMKQFPGGMYFQSVQMQMQGLIDEKRRWEEDKPAADDELAKWSADRDQKLSEAEKRGKPLPIEAQCGLEFRPCSILFSHHQQARAIEECPRYVKRFEKAEPSTCHDLTFMASYMRMLALTEVGNFDEARAAAQGLAKQDPKLYRDRAAMLVETWPKD